MRAGAAPILPGGPALIVVRGCGAVIKTKLKTKNKKRYYKWGKPVRRTRRRGGRAPIGGAGETARHLMACTVEVRGEDPHHTGASG